MKPIWKNLRICALLMTALILFQSCVVYHRTPESLDQVVKSRTKTKVVTAKGAVEKYKYVIEENGQYYGVKKKGGELQKTHLENYPGTEIFLKNKTVSTLVTVLAPLVLLTSLGIYIFDQTIYI